MTDRKIARCRAVLAGAALAVLAFPMPVPAAMRRSTTDRPSAAAALQELDGAMPRSLDIYPSDPCWGPWTMTLPGGGDLDLLMLRYRGVPIVHVEGEKGPSNVVWTRTSPTSIRFVIEAVTNDMTCVGRSATLKGSMVIEGMLQTLNIAVRRGAFPLP